MRRDRREADSNMTDRKPVYVLAPRGSVADAVLPGPRPIPLARAEEMRGRPPGVLLLPVHSVPGDQLVAALLIAAEAAANSAWLPVLVESDADGEVRARPVSIGWPAQAAELARWAEGEMSADVFELRHVLERVARGRHDLNNPLTSAMAETQLALLEASEPEVRAGLETIDQQLKRMRDMIAALKALRAPL
jgi:signal transduction histidine kinase